jgi:hypothetical protein
MNSIGPGIIAIVTGIIGLAIVAVVVSQNANTSSVIGASGSALSSVIGAAVSPVAGNNTLGSVASPAAQGAVF